VLVQSISTGIPAYHRHQPEQTTLYSIIAAHYPRFIQKIEHGGGHLPKCVRQEFDDYLKCGLLKHGFLRVKCDGCRHEHLVAFSCKRRGFCPSCGARRMVESAAHLVDHVLPEAPVRQWVLTFPFPLRFLFANNPQALTAVLAVAQRAISTFVIRHSGLTVASGARTGAVTLIQRFGSALNLNVHLHMLFLDGAYTFSGNRPTFHRARRPAWLAFHCTRPPFVKRINAAVWNACAATSPGLPSPPNGCLWITGAESLIAISNPSATAQHMPYLNRSIS
jgi:ribosomal protein S27E